MIRAGRYIFLFICWLISISAVGQDLHFSQYLNSPLTTNPANTGFIPEADFRIGGNYRNQWSSIMSSPYLTYSVFGDAQLFREKLDNGWLGVGGVMLSDLAGAGSLRSTKIYASVAYHQMLGNSSLLSAGFNAGWVNKRIDPSGLKFPDQFDGRFFDATRPTSVVLTSTSISFFDLQAGVNYAYFPKSDVYINAGYSIHHINQPTETFFGNNRDDNRVAMRHIGFLNAVFKLNADWILQPSFYYTNQARASAFCGGVQAFYNLSEFGNKQLLAGLYYRHNDAVAPMIGFELNNVRFTFSYDATISTLRNFNNLKGASEFSLIKSGFYPTTSGRQSLCPRF